MDTRVALDVVDDGARFDPGAVASRPADENGGFGLAAMRSRIRSLGGTWSLGSAPGQGTAVAADFPCGPGTEQPFAHQLAASSVAGDR